MWTQPTLRQRGTRPCERRNGGRRIIVKEERRLREEVAEGGRTKAGDGWMKGINGGGNRKGMG